METVLAAASVGLGDVEAASDTRDTRPPAGGAIVLASLPPVSTRPMQQSVNACCGVDAAADTHISPELEPLTPPLSPVLGDGVEVDASGKVHACVQREQDEGKVAGVGARVVEYHDGFDWDAYAIFHGYVCVYAYLYSCMHAQG